MKFRTLTKFGLRLHVPRRKSCARHNGLRRLLFWCNSLKTKSRFYRTIHLEVMPDCNARLDGITMRVLIHLQSRFFSQEVGMLRKAWIVGISAAMAACVLGATAGILRKTRRRRGCVVRSIR